MVLSIKTSDLKEQITSKIIWLEDKNDVKKHAKKGLYFFKKENEESICYIGVGGTKTKDLQYRVNQYYSPSNIGSKFFKCKLLEIVGESSKDKWETFKKDYQKEWKETISHYQIGIIPLDDYEAKELLFAESLAMGVFKSQYNF